MLAERTQITGCFIDADQPLHVEHEEHGLPVGMRRRRTFARGHRSMFQHQAGSRGTLFPHTVQEVVHVRETPLHHIQQGRADLRSQSFEIKAL
jgi:hypothetical protein